MGGSFDILRQSGWDLWCWLCLAAAAVLAAYAVLTRPWRRPGGWPATAIIVAGIAGTAVITALPQLHDPWVGLAWTLILMALVSAVFYLNLRPQLGARRMFTLLGMRTVALILLVPMLFEPVWRFVSRPSVRQPISFLIDTSGSMSVPDVANGPSRVQTVWQTLAPLLPAIQEHFVPRFYTFSSDCTELNKPSDLAGAPADGKATDFAAAVSKAAAGGPGDLVLISDGNDNVSTNVVDLLEQSQRKIHTLTVGSESAAPANLINVAVDGVQTPQEAAVGHASTITATIKNTALTDHVVDVNLAEVDDAGKTIGGAASARLVLANAPAGQTVDLHYTPPTTGVHRLAVWIDPIPGERVTADNRQETQLLAIEGRIKVLYIEGALRPEYTYLNRMFSRDADVEWATLLRLQRDRFEAAGVVDGKPFTAMPANADDWAKFDCVIIGDLDSSFLTPAEQGMIRKRVSDGGGLLMIGGEKNFGPGGYQGSPLEEALPVFVGGVDSPQDADEFVPELTPIGAGHPILQDLTAWFAVGNRAPTKTLAPLKGNVVVPGPKAGAQILMVHPGNKQIVLAVQQFGRGRSAAFTAATTNVWFRQFREQGAESVYNQFWGQMIRWLAGQDVRNREKGPGLQALLNKSDYAFGEAIKARAIVRDQHGDTTPYAQVTATLSAPAAKPRQIPMAAVESQNGQYQLVLPLPGESGLKPGAYTLDVSATKDGADLGRQQLKFTVMPAEDEMLNLAANPKLMAEIADQTQGFHYPLGGLPDLIDTLVKSDPKANQVVQRTVPVSNTVRAVMALAGHDVPWPEHTDLPMEGVLVILLLAGEWVLRRKWQLP